MKFIHIADVHIGAVPEEGKPLGPQREKEILESFSRVVNQCIQEEIDLLLIAGDLFHKQPLVRELKEVNYYFSKLKHTRVVLIAGNHDYISSHSNYIGFTWNSNVFMLREEQLDSIYFEDINTEVYGFSYHCRDIMEPRYQKVCPGVEERINILLAHGGDPYNVPIDKKRLEEAGFDYVALGHIHKPERISDRMAYAGSLEPLDKNELGQHGYFRGDINKIETSLKAYHTELILNFVAFSARQYIVLALKINSSMTNGSLQDLIRQEIEQAGSQNIFRLVLEGRRDVDIKWDKVSLSGIGNIVEIIDNTLPDYDFDRLYRDNRENIIGLYIERIRLQAGNEMITQKALCYGLEALLKARHT